MSFDPKRKEDRLTGKAKHDMMFVGASQHSIAKAGC